MNDEKIVIEDERREAFIQFVTKQLQPNVLKTLNVASQQPKLSNKRRFQLLKCFEAWVVDKTPEEVKQELHQLNLIQLCFDELGQASHESNCEEAADALCTLMIVCKDANQYQPLYQTILKGLIGGKQKIQNLIVNRDTEELKAYLDIFSVMIVRIMPQSLIEPQNEAVRFAFYDVILKVYEDQQLDLVSKSTSVIVQILKKLDLKEKPDDSQIQLKMGFMNEHLPFFAAIIKAACKHSALILPHMEFFETRSFHSDDDHQDFEDKNTIRQDTKKMLGKLSKILSFMPVFSVIAAEMQNSIQQMQQPNINDDAMNQLLVKFEGELFCILSIVESMSEAADAEAATIQQMLELILNINYTKQKVLDTSLKIVSKCSNYFGQRTDLLQLAFKLLAKCISMPKFENEAAEAIANLCKNNKSFVISNLADFFECTIYNLTQFITKFGLSLKSSLV